MKLAAAVLASLLSFATAARADDQVGPPPQRPRGELHQMLVRHFDRDGDGRLEPDERRQAARALRRIANKLARPGVDRKDARGAALRQRLIQRYDLDGDGNVGPGEMPPEMARRLRRIDRNRDGWLDGADTGR